MKITAKLAFSQIKINRSRTLWTLTGIVLATALITAVCGFAASGNALVADLLGESYGGYGGTFAALLLFPAGILSAIIVSMSVVVISNAFRVSAGERMAQFGTLKSAGATKGQITETVMYESILLSAAGIPAGIILGLIIAFAGVQAANHFLGEINSLVHMMINEINIVIEFVVAWQALAVAALMSFLTVLLSAWLPARKAAIITAIEGIRGAGEIKVETKHIRTSPLTQKLFGFEGTLAAKNMKRNKRNFRASVVSLTIGIILFINLSALSDQAGKLGDLLYPDIGVTVMVDYVSLRNIIINEATGRRESIIAVPINSEAAEAVTERLLEYGDATIFGIGYDMETYAAVIPREMITPRMIEARFHNNEQREYEVRADILTVDKANYAALCERAGVPSGSNILLNHYSYNDNGRAAVITPFLPELQNLRLLKADNSIHEMPVHGVLAREDIPNELLGANVGTVRLIVPQGDMRGYQWMAGPADIGGFMDYANLIMAEMFPRRQDAAYMELGFTTRVFKTQDYMKIMNIGIVLAMVFTYSFTALLALIGITNVISTMSANVRMRSREFAVLRSIGMTHAGLMRMLNLESLMYSAKSLVIGLPAALVLTYLITLPVRSMFPIPYQFPWLAAAACIAAIFAITWAVIRYSAFRLRGRNIVETIRSESGR